jgi:hypothetical protein
MKKQKYKLHQALIFKLQLGVGPLLVPSKKILSLKFKSGSIMFYVIINLTGHSAIG